MSATKGSRMRRRHVVAHGPAGSFGERVVHDIEDEGGPQGVAVTVGRLGPRAQHVQPARGRVDRTGEALGVDLCRGGHRHLDHQRGGVDFLEDRTDHQAGHLLDLGPDQVQSAIDVGGGDTEFARGDHGHLSVGDLRKGTAGGGSGGPLAPYRSRVNGP